MTGPRHGMSYFPEYQVYATAKDRCTNPNSQRWKSHGGRGIEMRFKSFEDFYAYVGPRPVGDYSIERLDNNGHYEPSNVKWATRSEQQKNKRPHVKLKRHGKGYYFHKLSGKWMVRIKYKNIAKYCGLYVSEVEAKQRYEQELAELKAKHGEECTY